MKLLKYLLSVMCICFLTGCTFEYNLYIDKNTFSESGSLINNDSSTWDVPYLETEKTIRQLIDQSVNLYETVYISEFDSYAIPTYKAENTSYYKTKKISDSKSLGINYSFSDAISKYYDTQMINKCYDEVSVENKDKLFSIYTSNNFKCLDMYSNLDSVKVNISTSYDYKIVSSNADSIKNGIYTWLITKDNASNKPIKIEFEKVFNWRLMLIIVVPSVIVISTVVFILRKKFLKNNQL